MSQSQCDNHGILYRWLEECTALLLFSLAELGIHPHLSHLLLLMFMCKYTHTMHPLTMMLLKIVEKCMKLGEGLA